jgi:hypothetical protein
VSIGTGTQMGPLVPMEVVSKSPNRIVDVEYCGYKWIHVDIYGRHLPGLVISYQSLKGHNSQFQR